VGSYDSSSSALEKLRTDLSATLAIKLMIAEKSCHIFYKIELLAEMYFVEVLSV
jgi:hypothetical protein